MQSTDQCLTAFYDLQICPVTFDFVVFLVLADMARRRAGVERMHVVLVPGPADGFRDDDVAYDAVNKTWRVQNIMLPALGFLASPPSFSLCRDRAEATAWEARICGPVFPEGYRVAAPRGDFLWTGIAAASARGEPIPRLRATAQARDYMRRWLETAGGTGRPIAITLRESSHAPVRNSDVAAWSAFAHSLDAARYKPIFIRDTEMAFHPHPPALEGLTVCREAAVNLDLRLALYELAWLNLMVPNGPGILCWLSDRVRFLMLKCANAGWANTRDIYWNTIGIVPGGQFHGATPFQRLVWEMDDEANIRKAFESMAAALPDEAPAAAPSVPPEPPIEVALRLYHAGRIEDALSVAQDIVAKDSGHADAWHLLGIIAGQSERPDLAEKALAQSLRLNPRQGNVLISLGTVLRRLGRTEEALAAYWKGVTLLPEHAGGHADLAEAMAAAGEGDEAANAMRQALTLSPDSIELHDRAARLFDDLGQREEALSAFRRTAVLRDARTARIREQVAERPEISPLIVRSG